MNSLEFAMGSHEYAKWMARIEEAERSPKLCKPRPRRVIPPNYTRSEWRRKQRTLRKIQTR